MSRGPKNPGGGSPRNPRTPRGPTATTPADAAGAAGATPPWPARVQMALDAGRLRIQAFAVPEVVAVWAKAVSSAHDAQLPGMSVDGALRAAYDAGHLAALAVLATHGLRPGSGPGHHEMAFYGAAAFGYPGLDDLVPDSEEVRRLRKGSMYDPIIAGPTERNHAIAWMQRTLPAIRSALVAKLGQAAAAGLASFP